MHLILMVWLLKGSMDLYKRCCRKEVGEIYYLAPEKGRVILQLWKKQKHNVKKGEEELLFDSVRSEKHKAYSILEGILPKMNHHASNFKGLVVEGESTDLYERLKKVKKSYCLTM